MDSWPIVIFDVEPGTLPLFFVFFQQGVILRVESGSTLKSLLCDQLHLTPEYLEERVKTLLLDGKPVDELSAVHVKSGATIALSGALPGLAGATLRRGGHLAAFRRGITHDERQLPMAGAGWIALKLFNLLIRELGPLFLKRGVGIPWPDFQGFLKQKHKELEKGCRKILWDGKEVSLQALTEATEFSPSSPLSLQVHSDLTR